MTKNDQENEGEEDLGMIVTSTSIPTVSPTESPTVPPTETPTNKPSKVPTDLRTNTPTLFPTPDETQFLNSISSPALSIYYNYEPPSTSSPTSGSMEESTDKPCPWFPFVHLC